MTFILDFEEAFDTPPQEVLKYKLYGYGISGKTLKWIDSFLYFRQQRVVVNGPRGGILTFACYRGSAAALNSTPPPKKYLHIPSYPNKYQDFSATKNANNAEHTEKLSGIP